MVVAVLLLVVSGVALGWLASLVLQIEDTYGIISNLAVGVIGAVTGGMVIFPLLGGNSPLAGLYGLGTLLVSFVTAAGALTVFHVANHTAIH